MVYHDDMKCTHSRGALATLVLLSTVLTCQPVAAEGWAENAKQYRTRYYVLYSDMDLPTVREAALRLTRMAQHYHQRTKALGEIRQRLPFYLFSRQADYIAAGGMAGSAGQYSGDKLMAWGSGQGVWSTMQHEGFHQFVHRAIGGRMPVWLNEGLAEYFGHSHWTGDGFVSGVIPAGLKGRLDKQIRRGQLVPFQKMLSMTSAEWLAKLERKHYDQAWAMVHFLVHAKDRKYRQALGDMIRDISRGADPVASFRKRITRNIDGFEKHFVEWWKALPGNPSAELETEILVQTLTSYLARAQLLGLELEDVDAFFKLAGSGEITSGLESKSELWLPQSLLKQALARARRVKGWQLKVVANRPRLILPLDKDRQMVGWYTISNGNKVGVQVEVEPVSQPDR